MNDLQKFLLETPVDGITEDVKISDRFSEKFKIKPLSGADHQKYQQLCIENPADKKRRKFNLPKFYNLIVTNHTVYPNFRDVEWLEAAGIADKDPAKLVQRTLLAGEIEALAEAILTLSGFNQKEEEELVEEVKNF
jgi:hypothetical protein